jgi:hypothetical protein
MFLTAEEIEQLTGYLINTKQIEWLRNRVWKYEVSRTGRPVVLRSYAESKLSDEARNQEWSPNVASLRKVA